MTSTYNDAPAVAAEAGRRRMSPEERAAQLAAMAEHLAAGWESFCETMGQHDPQVPAWWASEMHELYLFIDTEGHGEGFTPVRWRWPIPPVQTLSIGPETWLHRWEWWMDTLHIRCLIASNRLRVWRATWADQFHLLCARVQGRAALLGMVGLLWLYQGWWLWYQRGH